MPDSAPAERDQAATDLLHAWMYAINAPLGPEPDIISDPDRREHAIQRRQRRFADYARMLLRELDADSDRLAAVAAAARTKSVQRGTPDDPDRGWLDAVRLAELALGMIRQAGADTDPAARTRLLAELAAETTWEPTPYRQGPLHRHGLLRRALRRLDPRWWTRRSQAQATVRLLHHPPRKGPVDYQQIELLLGDRQIGRLDYQLCQQCRLGFVAKLSIDEDQQGRGLGALALELAHRQAPGYRWHTSGQYDTAETYWRRIGRRTGAGYQQANPCQHMD